MRKYFWVLVALMMGVSACNQSEEFHGLWQEPICRSSPCLPKVKMHLGQYGNAVAGVVAWVRTQADIDTFNTPSYECGCDYIQAGSVRGDTLTLTTFPMSDCEANPHCSPCGCDNYDIQVTVYSDERLRGHVICADGTQHIVEFERALGTPKDSCEYDDE